MGGGVPEMGSGQPKGLPCLLGEGSLLRKPSNYPGSQYRGWAEWAWGTGEQTTSLLLDKEVPPPRAHQLVPGRSILGAVAKGKHIGSG